MRIDPINGRVFQQPPQQYVFPVPHVFPDDGSVSSFNNEYKYKQGLRPGSMSCETSAFGSDQGNARRIRGKTWHAIKEHLKSTSSFQHASIDELIDRKPSV